MLDVTQGYSQVTSLSTAKTLGQGTLGAIPAGTQYALVTVEGQAVRWTDDGTTTPTASLGMPMAVGETRLFDTAITKLKFIEQTSGAKLNVSFYKTTTTLLPGAMAKMKTARKKK